MLTVVELCLFVTATACPANDIWADLSATVGTPPAAEEDACAAYDSLRKRMLYFGGQLACGAEDDEGTTNAVWALDLNDQSPTYLTWIELIPNIDDTREEVSLPQSREDSAAVYDSARDAFVIFAGDARGRGGSCTTLRLNDAWSLDLAQLEASPGQPELAWTELAVTGTLPPKVKDHTAIYDPLGGRLVAYGEQMGTHIFWLDLATQNWTRKVYSGGGDLHYPHRRERHVSSFDPIMRRMIVFAGTGCDNPERVWALTLAELDDVDGTIADDWEELTPASGPHPTCRQQAISGFDTRNDQFLVFGGKASGNLTNDTWALVLDPNDAPVRWVELLPGDPAPPLRTDHTGLYDPGRHRFMLFGGDGANGYLSDTWELRLMHPGLRLDVDPDVVQVGDLIAFTTSEGLPFTPAILMLVEVNGVPTGVRATFGVFDAACTWAFSGTVGPGLAGIGDLTFLTFGIDKNFKVTATNRKTVSFL